MQSRSSQPNSFEVSDANPMPGPRDYATGTEKALFLLSEGTCYFPGCSEPVIRWVDKLPVVNVAIAHIAGAFPNSARYDAGMSDRERASFDNLVLLCKPHHDLVDRLKPSAYPRKVLEGWKVEREERIGGLKSSLSTVTEDRLEGLMEAVVTAVAPRREVTVELRIGYLAEAGVVAFPLGDLKQFLAFNPRYRDAKSMVVTAVRNTGTEVTYLDGFDLHYVIERPEERSSEITLTGRNDYPHQNPQLPRRLDVGESINWLADVASVRLVVFAVGQSGHFRMTALVAAVRLGSGETVRSEKVPIDLGLLNI